MADGDSLGGYAQAKAVGLSAGMGWSLGGGTELGEVQGELAFVFGRS